MKRDRVYVSLPRLARALKYKDIAHCVKSWEKKSEYLNLYLVGNQKMLLRKDANKIIQDWKRSCTPGEAAEKIEVSTGSISQYIYDSAVDAIVMFGLYRVLLSSIERGKMYQATKYIRRERAQKKGEKTGRTWSETEIKQMYEEVRAGSWQRNPNARPTQSKKRQYRKVRGKRPSKESLNARPIPVNKGPITISPEDLYRPTEETLREQLGTKRLVTPEVAARYLGTSVNLLENCGLRMESVDEDLCLYYAHSIETYYNRGL